MLQPNKKLIFIFEYKTRKICNKNFKNKKWQKIVKQQRTKQETYNL